MHKYFTGFLFSRSNRTTTHIFTTPLIITYWLRITFPQINFYLNQSFFIHHPSLLNSSKSITTYQQFSNMSSFVAAFGTADIALNAAVLIATTLPQGQNPKVQIGCGSPPLNEDIPALTGGSRPDIVLYNARGQEIRKSLGATNKPGEQFIPGANPIIDMGDLTTSFSSSGSITPEYAKIVARGDDAVCVSYLTTQSVGNKDTRTWHAGYTKECARLSGSTYWFPSPEVIPGTDHRPGCIWLSQDSKKGFPAAISVKLTDFAFPTSDDAAKAQTQYQKTPNVLCQAPGRMAFWAKASTDECIPFYDSILEKNKTTGFDVDNQKVVDGHKIPCRLKGTLMNQILEPGKGPRTPNTLTDQEQKEKDLKDEEKQRQDNENGANPNTTPCENNFGGICRQIPKEESDRKQQEQEQRLNEDGQNKNGAGPGASGFGGLCGSIPQDKLVPGEPAQKVQPCPEAPPPTKPSQDGGRRRRLRNRKRVA
ncbi:unnamed protein product [Periconia digitata]|uniref:Uncharacterized protein n=1 Tax=Periconia digitata TaxID=1303443 RepID=A0A9W4TZM8_9PLEO|nr:unnamed protein product [Periconia digitata]